VYRCLPTCWTWGFLMPQTPTDRARWHELSWLVGLCACSARVMDARPVSMMIVGPPGCGKTELLNRYHSPQSDGHNMMLAYASQASQWGVQGVMKEAVPRGVTHLVVTELQTLLLRKNAVWLGFLGLMLQAMEEGVGDFYNGPKKLSFNSVRLGLLCAMTTDAYYQEENDMRGRGFLSRMIVVRWSRTDQNVNKSILCANEGDTDEITPLAISFPKRAVCHVSTPVANEIAAYAFDTDKDNQRRQAKRLTTLAKVIAVLDGKDEVAQGHWHALRAIEWTWRSQT